MLSLVILLLSMPLWAVSQTITVKGVVKDLSGEGMPGVNVSQVGTTNGTITDLSGNYQIIVPSNATIKFTFVGYTEQTVSVGGPDKP
ncbi:MAG: hypothetical protein BGN96_11385 [Bacteroidales bacterium 45-6]|nr:MAG: hypothetical protein BGN96_11385 [Bacteroidales bacterium 45-6]